MSQILQFSRQRWYVPVAILIISIIFSFVQAQTQDASGDPYIFWAAGGKFLKGQALYEPIAGAQEFIYPPVAALLFQILALMPFPVAVGVFTFFNFMSWLALIWLTYRILEIYFPQANLRTALIIGFVATIRYFWHNIVWANVNELIALLSVGGLYLYLKNKQIIGLGLLTLAMWLKVMPLLIIGVLFIRRPLQTLLPVVGFSGLFLLMIMGLRGINQGIQDYFDFWSVAFKPFLLEGRVYTDWIAFGLSSLLSKLLMAHPDINGIRFNIVSWPPELVGRISLILRLLVLAITYFYVWQNRQQARLPLTNILLVYLAILLVSGVSWEGHHVPLLLVIAGLYQSLTALSMNRLRRWMVTISIIIGLTTSDLVGGHISDYLQAFSLITYNVLFLFIVAVVVSHRLLSKPILGQQLQPA
jgi:hypothetical protein